MQNRFSLLERYFSIFTLLIASGNYDMLIFGNLAVESDTIRIGTSSQALGELQNNPSWMLIQYSIILFTLILVGIHWPSFWHAASRRRCIWLLAGLAPLSCLWCAYPNEALRKGMLLILSDFFAIYLAFRYSIKEQMELLSWVLGIATFSNIAFTVGFPAYAIHTALHPGAWRGLFSHKNSLAELSVMSALLFLVLVVTSPSHQRAHRVGLAASVAVVLLTTSKTGLTLMLLLFLLVPLLQMGRSRAPAALPILLIAGLGMAALVVGFVGNYELILSSLGRDATLTGRTGIWSTLVGKIALRPWIGYGYRGFWHDMEGDSADIWYNLSFMISSAHNGYLDMALELGLIGLGAFVTSFIMSLMRGLTWLRLAHSEEALWPLLYTAYYLLYNVTESTIPDPVSLAWIVYIALTTTILIQRLPGLERVRTPILVPLAASPPQDMAQPHR